MENTNLTLEILKYRLVTLKSLVVAGYSSDEQNLDTLNKVRRNSDIALVVIILVGYYQVYCICRYANFNNSAKSMKGVTGRLVNKSEFTSHNFARRLNYLIELRCKFAHADIDLVNSDLFINSIVIEYIIDLIDTLYNAISEKIYNIPIDFNIQGSMQHCIDWWSNKTVKL